MSTSLMTRAPSPTFSAAGRSFSPAPSPAPFLTPNPCDFDSARPVPKRLHSLQYPSRPAPYPNSFSASPSFPPSSSKNATARPTLGGGSKRPGVPHRSQSFCASGSNTTYALASATACSNLSPDKRILVAPPLERTISSIGSRGNCSPPSHQMQRPFPFPEDLKDLENLRSAPARQRPQSGTMARILGEKDVNYQSTPPSIPNSTTINLPSAPTVPTIVVHASTTPPRPSLSTLRSISSGSSRSSSYSSYSTHIQTPTTPHDHLFGSIEEDEEDVEKEVRDDVNGWEEVEGVAQSVQGMLIDC